MSHKSAHPTLANQLERHLELEVATCVGGVSSPLLANKYLHYALDAWMSREFPHIQFERYADDAVVHCQSQMQAHQVRDAVAARMVECGLQLHPDKTKEVYCKDSNRKGSYEHEQFDFLSYTFRPRRVKSKAGKFFVSFTPAVSNDAAKRMRREVKRWRLHLWASENLQDLATFVNPIVQGWINYYGRFYKSWLTVVFKQLNDYLARWGMRKYKRLKRSWRRGRRFLAHVARRDPELFAHWRHGFKPSGWTLGAG